MDITTLITIAQETKQVLKLKGYLNKDKNLVDMTGAIDFCVENTKYYDPEDNLDNLKFKNLSPTMEVTDETSCDAAVRLISEGKKDLCILNFASATTPGGGWLHGAMAQEEDLVRCSALYSSIKSKPIFYNTNILYDNAYYTDGIIFSPRVPFFRNHNLRFMDFPYMASVITSPAPNLNHIQEIDIDLLNSTITNRIEKIIRVAIDNNVKTLILGAWGCGVFGNDPNMVASAFLSAIEKYPAFDHICFAVYDKRKDQPVFNSFKNIINGI